MSATVIFSGTVRVEYAQFYVVASPVWEAGTPEPAFAGQSNGLCGAQIGGGLWMVVGRPVGRIALDVELCSDAWPDNGEAWEDVAEVSLSVSRDPVLIVEWGLFEGHPLEIPRGQYRVRYSCNGMDLGAKQVGPREPDLPQVDRYRLQFLPSDEWRADDIVKVSSNTAMRRNAEVG